MSRSAELVLLMPEGTLPLLQAALLSSVKTKDHGPYFPSLSSEPRAAMPGDR